MGTALARDLPAFIPEAFDDVLTIHGVKLEPDKNDVNKYLDAMNLAGHSSPALPESKIPSVTQESAQ